MSKYKLGDKVVLTVTSTNEMGCLPCYVLNDDLILSKQDIDKYTEPLTAYTEQARADGAETAWEMARKIAVIPKDGGYGGSKLIEIFNTALNNEIFNLTYPEAAAKVAEWEKAKEEIKVGDVVESNNGNGERIAVIDVWPSFDGLHFEGISSNRTLTIDASAKYYTKTGRHIDIGSFLKQIGGEE